MDRLQHVLLDAPLRIRWWAWGLVLIGISCVVLTLVKPATPGIEWGPSTRFCGASYVEMQNNSIWPIATDGWWFGDRSTQYRFPHRWLLPGTSVRLWPGSGTDDDFNLYAGGTAMDWEMSTASVNGFPQRLFIKVSCDLG